MKKFLVFLCALFICAVAFAHTINWHVGDQIISTTTCDSGDSITPPAAPAKYGYHLKGWQPYVALEYIESTGTQWIDTGVSGFDSDDWEIYAKWEMTTVTQSSNYPFVFGVYSNEDTNSYRLITNKKDSTQYYVSANSKAGGGSLLTSVLNLYTTHEILMYSGSFILDGVNYTATTFGTALPSNLTMGIFWFRGAYGQPIKTRIYSAWAKKDGVLQYYLVPARNPAGVVGMYDKVTKQFFYNQGTGEFIAGPEVDGLQ